jgi:hypothetical protein
MNNVYLELGGNGILLTVNYEKFLTHQLNLRVGGMIIPTSSGVTVVGTLMGNMLWSKGSLGLETGLGVLIITDEWPDIVGKDSTSTAFGITATLGLRYQPEPGGMVLRLGFTPIMAGGGIYPWVGASVGYSFR